MAMKNSFANAGSNLFSRNFGGTTLGVADPYVTGYHFIWFDKLPESLYAYTANEESGQLDKGDVKRILAGTCTGVTPPGGTLNKIEFTGLGGVKWAVPGNIDYGNTVSLKFTEMNDLPILSIMHSWVKMIRDYRTGATDLIDDTNNGYTKATYAGLLYYWTTAPDGKSIEYYACYDGVFPAKDPQDLFSSDVETIGKLDIEIEFNVDYAWHEPWVKRNCQTLSNNFTTAKGNLKARQYQGVEA